MEMTAEQVTEKALRLRPAARAMLAEQLYQRLAEANDPEIERLWVAEAVRRCAELDSGAVTAIPGEQVLAEVRKGVGR
jgi:putative addiction module component (TIGR02574 family)